MSQTDSQHADVKATKPWLLVVDDSRVVRKAILKILGPDFSVIEAPDGMVAWQAISRESRIDVVITDIMMPKLDGYHLICKIRAADDPGLREVPVIAITSAEDDITRERAYACGANDFILKPFNARQLLACVLAHVADQQRVPAGGRTTHPPAMISTTANVESIIIPDTNAGTLADALEHLDTGLNILRGLKTSIIAPEALTLVLRFLPLLKYCNTAFKLGMDREIAAFQERVSTARGTLTDSAGDAA